MIGIAVLIAIVAIGVLVERIFPAAGCPIRGVVFNVGYAASAMVLQTIAVAAVAGSAVTATNALGGGLVTLPSEGWLLVPAIAGYALVMDFGEYLFHRVQHRIPAMWAMHSLHHSDQAMNISTTYRHFWVDQAIKTVTIYFLVGLLFRANVTVLSGYGATGILHLFFHMNIPVGLGRGWFLLNSPQFHRIHHSSFPEHLDKNFAGLFPIFDAVFRTAHPPRRGEFPPTGLYDGDSPRGVVEAVMWPLRNAARRRAASAAQPSLGGG
jgi:sterol desaturase/sphingolipid hydroxylase (fatty acid hydroxylase superfamily)